MDVFDVPSEDEFVAYSVKPTKKFPTKSRNSQNDANTRTTNVEIETIRQRSEATQLVRRADASSLKAPAAAKPRKPLQVSRILPTPAQPSDTLVARPSRRGKTPQSTQEDRTRIGTKNVEQHAIATSKEASCTDSAIDKATHTKTTKAPRPIRDVRVKTVPKPASDVDVYDVPSSDDEVHMPTPRPSRRAPIMPRDNTKMTKLSVEGRPQESADSEDSETIRKRKRRGSLSLSLPIKPILEKQGGGSLPQRNRKYQKKEDSVSPGHDQVASPIISTIPDPQVAPTAFNKPRRTRIRTVPVLTQPATTKGHSSPARLHSMLPNHNVLKPSPVVELPGITAVEDETMYEIPDLTTTPVRPSNDNISVSITPRQKALFGSLLGTSSSNTPMPSMSRLQLTDRKPSSLLGALSRSSSDLTQSVTPKKTRLIASLKPASSSSDAEDSDSENESESDSEKGEDKSTVSKRTDGNKTSIPEFHRADNTSSSTMDINVEEAADSQMSQATSGFGNRSKFTYAKSRSYLQEENPEDALLMSMDLDDPLPFGSQTKESQTEEEEEANHVRPNHELKRQGHNTKFQWENQMLIDDMDLKSANGIRRSALLELCTKMADKTFAHSLLESSLADQFFENIASNGEIVFDFAAAVALIFMLRNNPTYTTFDQVHRSGLKATLEKLLSNDTDIHKIAKSRKTNLSRMAQEVVATFRSVVIASPVWSSPHSEVLSPQLVALKALELLVVGLRDTSVNDPVINSKTVGRLIDIAASTSQHYKEVGQTAEDRLTLSLIFSILEAISLLKQKHIMWSSSMLHSLADSMAVIFQDGDAPTVTLVVKLCMNLTNNKPKACQHFSDSAFLQPLVSSIVDRTRLLLTGLEEAQRAEALDTLILSLGAMINLTEHSDQARKNVDDGDRLIQTLAETFVEGTVRTALVSSMHNSHPKSSTYNTQAVSMEESQSSVAIGYLSVMLGNMCLNTSIKYKIQAHLPNQRLTTLTDKIKEFVQVHEHANRKAKQYEGDEGQETWQNYTTRIMHVVERLELAGT